MNRVATRIAAIAALAVAVAATHPGHAQAQAAQGFPKEFKNLLAFDKTIAPDVLKKTMNGFTDQLGVKCTFCHNLDNYASDEKKHKTNARKMIQLVQFMQANKAKYFKADVSNDLIACGTCHRGKEEPEPFVP
jgi:spermidine/putrescine-binding protein